MRCAEECLEPLRDESISLGEEVKDATAIIVDGHDRDGEIESGDEPECRGIVQDREVARKDYDTPTAGCRRTSSGGEQAVDSVCSAIRQRGDVTAC